MRVFPIGSTAVLALPLLAACLQTASSPEIGSSGVRPAIEQAMTDCTAAHGYDPDTVTVGENALAPGERDWRRCIYAAIETQVIPQTPVPDVYRSLIADDRTMTEAVATGQLTRSARRDRLEERAAEIRAAEDWAASAAEIDRSADAALAALYQQYPQARELAAGRRALHRR